MAQAHAASDDHRHAGHLSNYASSGSPRGQLQVQHHESSEASVFTANLAGFGRVEDVQVQVEDDQFLVLRSPNFNIWKFPLPTQAHLADINATFKNDILTITIPKQKL